MVYTEKRGSQTYPLTSPFIPLGIVIGNNGLKLVGRASQNFISSILLRNPEQNLGDSYSDNGVLLDILDSTDDSINGQSFYVGRDAESLDRDAVERVAIADDGKRQLFKPVMLASFGLLPHADSPSYGVFLSAPYKSLANEYQRLEGVHRVRLNGQVSTITIKVLGIRPESHGAAYYLAKQRKLNNLPSEPIAIIDFGEGNTTILGADGNGKLTSHIALDGGVGQLINAIAQSDESISLNRGFPASHESVRLGIENRRYTFGGTAHSKSFEDQYHQQLQRWIKPKLDAVMARGKDVLDRSPLVYVIGGGAQLQGIQKHFPRHWSIAQNPQFIDAQGLELMASTKLKAIAMGVGNA